MKQPKQFRDEGGRLYWVVPQKAGEVVVFEGDTLTADLYEAGRCPECNTWVFLDAPPFGENDRTKPTRDFNHWARFHQAPAEGERTFGIPYFRRNDEPVEAVLEEWGPQ